MSPSGDSALICSVLSNMSDNDKPRKTKYTKYETETERSAERKKQRKQYDSARVYLGPVFDDWEQQRAACGGSHADFARHLLDLHKSCQNYRQVS